MICSYRSPAAARCFDLPAPLRAAARNPNVKEPRMSALAAAVPPSDQEDEVEMAIQICGGDVRAALRISLIANAFLEAEIDQLKSQVSAGFLRGRLHRHAADNDVEHGIAETAGTVRGESAVHDPDGVRPRRRAH
jgi:hypothetical protein